MQDEEPASADLDDKLPACVSYGSQLSPECLSPAIVISADHGDGHGAGKPSQRGCDGECAPGNDMAVAEPELEQITGYEEGVAEGRRIVQECEQRRFARRRRRADMRVGYH